MSAPLKSVSTMKAPAGSSRGRGAAGRGEGAARQVRMGRPGGRWHTSGPGVAATALSLALCPHLKAKPDLQGQVPGNPHTERPVPPPSNEAPNEISVYPPSHPPPNPTHPTASWYAGLRRGSRNSAGPAACRSQRWPARWCCPQSRGRSGWGLRKGRAGGGGGQTRSAGLARPGRCGGECNYALIVMQ